MPAAAGPADGVVVRSRIATVPLVDTTSAPAVVYGHALRNGALAPDFDEPERLGLTPGEYDDAVAQLLELRLVRESAEHGYLPISPEVAEAALVAPLNEQIQRARSLISQSQNQLCSFREIAEEHAAAQPARAEVCALHDAAELTAYLRVVATECSREFVGFCTDPVFVLPWVSLLGDRGPAVRLLLPPAARSDLRAAPLFKKLVRQGGDVRFACGAIREVLIFDDVAVFITARSADDLTAMVVRQPETVALLRDMLATHWVSATPLDADGGGAVELADEMHRVILELLVLGMTDESVAARLGMSVRTCRRHIASAFERLGARSRFQAGALAVARSLVNPTSSYDDRQVTTST
jgi:DNA-binding CsgD family transcriptional regulator